MLTSLANCGRNLFVLSPGARAAAVAAAAKILARTVLIVLCGSLLLLGGCSALRVGYNQADWLAYRWIAAYADFDDAQATRVRNAIAEWFLWNRRTQLPDYADLLLRIDAEVHADTNAQRVCGWWSEVRTRLDRGVERVVPAIAEIAATLTPAQLESIERRYAKTNFAYRDDFLQPDPAVRAGEALKRVVNRAESAYGDLDAFQRERIDRWMADSPFDPRLTDDERKRRQQDALQTLRQLAGQLPAPAASTDAAAARALIRGWVARVDRSPREPHRAYSASVVQYNCRLAANIHNSTSPAQRRAASQKLRAWAADLRALAAEAAG